MKKRAMRLKNIRWFLSAVIFIVIGVMIFNGLSEILRRKTGAEVDMINYYFDMKKDTVDVLCLGSSHAYSSFSPNVIWAEDGIASGLLSSPQQTVAMSYYLLRQALEHQSPKVVLFETYYLFEEEKYTEESYLRLAFDSTPLNSIKLDMLRDFLPELDYKERLSWYLPFIMYHGRWAELEAEDFQSDAFYRGGILDYTVDPQEEPELTDEVVEPGAGNIEYLNRIVELCESKGIRLVLFTVPYCDVEERANYHGKQGINNFVRLYAQEKGVDYLDYQDGNMAGIDYAGDFRESTHLNTYGCDKITLHLGDYLTEECGVPDRRNDKRYQQYWKDYREFQKAEEELLNPPEEEKSEG